MARQLCYLIIGNGIAGVTAAEILRAEDTTSSLTIIADDPFPVYYRPALKDYLAGRVSEGKLWARPSTFYREQRIRFVPSRVVGINTLKHFVQLQNGKQISYDKLLLANGARPRQLACPGLGLAGVTTLRTVADYREVLRRLSSTRSIVVCGSGTLALESAEALRQREYEVTHLLRYHALWSEVLDATASDLVLQEERRAGIDVRTGEAIRQIVGRNGQVSEVITSSGAHIPCDLVLIAIGIEPIIDFIQASGIACGRGVKVDAAMRTSAADIYAAGDVIETTDSLTGRTRVLGQWYPALQQARTAAYNMLGINHTYSEVGGGYTNYYNATFLCGLDFVSIGLTSQLLNAQNAQQLVEISAAPQPRSYRKALLLHTGVPIGALFLGERKHALAFKRAIDHRVNLAPVANRLFAEDFNLDDWLDKQQVPPAIFNARIANSTLHNNASGSIPDALHATLKDPSTPTLVLVSPDAEPQLVPLQYEHGRRFTLGRDRENDIRLDDRASSRRHAELFTAPDGFYLRDLGSSNGVFVNKVKISNSYHLSHGDRIVIGNTLIYFSFPQVPQQASIQEHGKHPITRLLDTAAGDTAKEPGLAHRADVRDPSLALRMTVERIHFEIDMCIGCDRCMNTCPVPMSSLVSIADLNHATASAGVASHVARFTHECIMCGSCVPVCPVDNHRDLLMLTLKQRLGVSWDDDVDMKRIAQALPAGWSIPLLISRLREHPLLSNTQLVPDRYLLHLFVASKLLSLAPGAPIIREGDYGRDLYLILGGQVSLFATESDGKEFPIAILGQGEYIGEYGMLTGQPYTTTARAQTPCALLQVPEQVMQRLMELLPNIRQFFDQLNNVRSLTSILKRMALFQGISDADIDALVKQTQVRQYDRNERLFAEDDTGGRPARETVHILLEGFVKVARHTTVGTPNKEILRFAQNDSQGFERIIAYRRAGDYFVGGLDLLGDGRAVTVTTINRTRVAEVSRPFMQVLLQRYPEVNQRFKLRLREYLESMASVGTWYPQGETCPPDRVPLHFTRQLNVDSPNASPDAALTAGLHALVSDGVVEGTEVLVIDLDTCIHCNECEEACTRRHGHSRMNRKGMVVGNISIATACRQCQDPICMLCSRAGIARLPNGEVYITESCIGCGICAERCPYGAISIVDVGGVEVEAEAYSSWQRFSNFFTNGTGKGHVLDKSALYTFPTFAGSNYVAPGPLDISRPRNAYAEMRKKVAIKCDLCVGYKDQACVEACPTGAAIRIQPTAFFGSTEEILRRRVL